MARFLVWLIVGACVAIAQTPKFEVASIKPSDPNLAGMYAGANPNGSLSFKGITLKALVMNAWNVQPFQITGGPAWSDTERFDVEAKPEKPAQTRERGLMLQELLRERFQVVVRKDTRDMPVYHLVLVRKDGKLGPRLKESACEPYDREHPQAPGTRTCGSGMSGGGRIDYTGTQIPDLALSLSTMIERTIIDQTGLSGKYDVKLNWSPDLGPSDNPSGPSVFTALEEQLGLKLEAAKGPVEMIVIEKAEKPTEN